MLQAAKSDASFASLSVVNGEAVVKLVMETLIKTVNALQSGSVTDVNIVTDTFIVALLDIYNAFDIVSAVGHKHTLMTFEHSLYIFVI